MTFGIIPHQASNLTFHISYQNGANTHTTDVVLPITIGQDKTAAVPVVNNVVLSSSGNTYEITGDITNAGVSDAKGVVVTVGSPAKGAGTYPEYAIGSIASDDSGSFDVTFTCNDLSSVPLVVSWKDTDGNDYSLTKDTRSLNKFRDEQFNEQQHQDFFEFFQFHEWPRWDEWRTRWDGWPGWQQ